MLTVAYLANEFPCAVEPYVGEEIDALRKRGVEVISGSARRTSGIRADVVLGGAGFWVWLRALVLCVSRWNRVSDLIMRAVFLGRESPWQRVKALAHTFLGACYAAMLEEKNVGHIHVHHGYFGSWVGMTAARLLGIESSLTLHGSDLLLHDAYLDTKLENCSVCFTVSEFNRNYILESYPEIDPEKVVVSRLGVDVPDLDEDRREERKRRPFTIVAVGRLHEVKDHAFLVRACAELRNCGVEFECLIAGEGPERRRLEELIRENNLGQRITLLGHVPRSQVGAVYERADLVVLTSRSEGIPLVLMEAMARRKVVLAPAITGIPELVVHGNTGYVYESGSMQDFVRHVQFVYSRIMDERSSKAMARAVNPLDWIRFGAQIQVADKFDRTKNLEAFCDRFLAQITRQAETIPDENLVLQQI